MATTFTLPPDLQSTSRLLQLPPELRIKILRQLHRNDQPLLGDTNLSGQALVCCQRIYGEACHILYAENVVSIRCAYDCPETALSKGPNWACFRCHILGTYADLPTNLHETGLEDHDLDWFALKDGQDSSPIPVQSFYTAASRFKKYQVSIDFIEAIEIWVSFRPLKGILRGKSVSIALRPVCELNDRTLTASCRILRCHSVAFDTTYYQEDPTELARTISIVESQEPVLDLFSQWCYLQDELICRLPGISDVQYAIKHYYADEQESLLYELGQAVYLNDGAKFQENRAKVITSSSSWIEDWKNDQEILAMERREEIERLSNEANLMDAEAEAAKHRLDSKFRRFVKEIAESKQISGLEEVGQTKK